MMRGAIFLLLALALASLEAHAISVASDYLVNGTLEVVEGSSKLYSIRLQNPTDYEAGVKLDYDKTFIKVIDYREVYTLQPKETGYRILFNVTAFQKPGTYVVGYTVSEVEPAGGGGLPIRLKVNRNFNLRIVEDPSKFHINYFLAGYILALAIAVFALFKKMTGKGAKKDVKAGRLRAKNKVISKK